MFTQTGSKQLFAAGWRGNTATRGAGGRIAAAGLITAGLLATSCRTGGRTNRNGRGKCANIGNSAHQQRKNRAHDKTPSLKMIETMANTAVGDLPPEPATSQVHRTTQLQQRGRSLRTGGKGTERYDKQ
jgi:hypothetical protein